MINEFTTPSTRSLNVPLRAAKATLRQILRNHIDTHEAVLAADAKATAASNLHRRALTAFADAIAVRDKAESDFALMTQILARSSHNLAAKIRIADAAREDVWRSTLSDDDAVFDEATKRYVQAIRDVQHTYARHKETGAEWRAAQALVAGAEYAVLVGRETRDQTEQVAMETAQELGGLLTKQAFPADSLPRAERVLIDLLGEEENIVDEEGSIIGWQCRSAEELGLLSKK